MVRGGDSYYGLLQAFADALKLILKEYVSPTQANLFLFFLGPIITLVFSLLGYAVIPYGPGLAISDFNLGILYMLAVSSLATYGILLAGWQIHIFITFCLFSLSTTRQSYFALICLVLFLYLGDSNPEYLLSGTLVLGKVKKNIHTRFLYYKNSSYSTLPDNTPTDPNGELTNIDAMKPSHALYIKELYRDRKAPVILFDRKSILATCYNCLDRDQKLAFLKEWGSKSCIYLIEYKHDPLIYYVGRTTLFKRRLYNHLKADSGNKLHIFLKLVG